MIINPPSNKYELQIYEEIANAEEYNRLIPKKDPVTKELVMRPEMSEGEKSILYDLAISLPKYIYFNLEDIDIPNYVHNCCVGYNKNKNVVLMQVIANCINACFPQKLAKLEGGSMYESKHLVIMDRPPKEEKKKEVKKMGNDELIKKSIEQIEKPLEYLKSLYKFNDEEDIENIDLYRKLFDYIITNSMVVMNKNEYDELFRLWTTNSVEDVIQKITKFYND